MGQRLEDGMEPGPPDPGIHTEQQQALTAERHEQHASAEGAMALAARGSTEGDAPRQRRPATKSATDAASETDESAVPDKELEQDVAPGKTKVPGTWGDKVRASAPNPTPITAEMARNAHMLDGVWNPLHIKQLIGTLMTEWNAEDTQQWTVEEAAMRMEAQMPAPACCDESVRDGTARENEILMAYLEGGLDLPHPPNFIKEILIGEHRAMVEDMHEAYFNVTLTAVVPTTVRLTRSAAHAVIFKELFLANTDKRTGHDMMRAFQRDVKRLSFDGIQTLQVVFYSRTAANRWQTKALRLQKAVIVLRDTQRQQGQEGTGLYTPAQLELQYAVRVYGGEQLGLTDLARAFASFTESKVLDVEYARDTRTNIYDNRYRTIRFAQQGCPEALRGVSMIQLDGTDITIHHFQQNLRRPCSRCLSPRHGTMKCTLATGKIPVTRAKSTRIFAGTVDYIKPAPRMEFSVKSLQELVDLLKKHQPESQPPRKLLEVTFRPLTADNATSTITGSTHRVAYVGQTQGDEGGSDTQNSCQDAEGYVTKEPKKSKANKAKARTAHLGEATSSTEISRENAQVKAPTKPKQHQDGKPKVGKNEQNIATRTMGATPTGTTATGKRQNGKAQRKPAKRFEKFQRHEALGQFGVLADSDSDDSADGDMDVDEEPFQSDDDVVVVDDDDAPYAFPDAKAVETKVEAAEDMDVVKEIANTPHQAATATRPSKSGKSVSISRHARRHKHAKAGVGLQEGAIKGMQTNMTNYMHQTVAVASQAKNEDEALGVEVNDGDTIIPATPESQEGVMIGDTRPGTDEGDQDLPIQLGHWLHSFQGREVKVAANGQCAFLAIHATNGNHARPEMKNTSAVIKDTTEFKWFVYSLMMANLRKDVELNLIDPIRECEQLHPERPKYTSVQGATAALYAHYDAARKRSAGRAVQVSYWAGPHELRAMAQYLREPIVVFDVDANSDAHVQRYFYGTQRLADGTDHESGYCTALKDREATDYLRNCWRLHVLPTFLILRHHERHFYGVSHGELYFKWRAEGDPEYTFDIAAQYEWKANINDMSHYERDVDLTSVNQLADIDEVNELMIKRLEMRVRMNLVHARLVLPILDTEGLTKDWEAILEAEEHLIHEDYGLDHYSAGSQTGRTENEEGSGSPRRYTQPATGELVMNSYFRILRAGPEVPMEEEDKPLSLLLMAANKDGFTKWVSMYRELFQIPATKRRTKLEDLRPWLLTRTTASRHLFAFLPYPELEAKSWTTVQLEEWGASEVFHEQIGALHRIIDDPQTKATVMNFCKVWLTAAEDMQIHRDTAYALARSPDRWKRLAQWLPQSYCRAQPQHLTEREWCVLHVLPYTIGTWSETPMGRASSGARETWYDKFPFLRTLCHGVVEHNDWSASTAAPTGQAWGESTEEMAVDPSPLGQN